MQVLYFAALRETLGFGEERVAPPAAVATVATLADWLADRSPAHRAAFADRLRLRAAVNQVFATPSTPVTQADEVAFFPPVTGG